MEEKKVYAVVEGYYSDYCIRAIFDNRVTAIALTLELNSNEEPRIQEFVLNTKIVTVYKNEIYMDLETGDVVFAYDNESIILPERIKALYIETVNTSYTKKGRKYIKAIGIDEEHAVKSAADFRREVLANPGLYAVEEDEPSFNT